MKPRGTITPEVFDQMKAMLPPSPARARFNHDKQRTAGDLRLMASIIERENVLVLTDDQFIDVLNHLQVELNLTLGEAGAIIERLGPVDDVDLERDGFDPASFLAGALWHHFFIKMLYAQDPNFRAKTED